jgi:hypothetical protein
MKPLWREPVQAPILAARDADYAIGACERPSAGQQSSSRGKQLLTTTGRKREHAIDGSAKSALLAVTERTTASPMQQPHRGG